MLAGLLLLIGTVLLSLPDVISGAFGDRDEATGGIEWLNKVTAVGGLVAVAGVLVVVVGLLTALRRRGSDDELAEDPWGTGSTLEWATASPPVYANFAEPPVVTSATPLLDAAPDRTAEGTTR
jgi:heme/copper-type cytochrome/quinol oxidase subunit 1